LIEWSKVGAVCVEDGEALKGESLMLDDGHVKSDDRVLGKMCPALPKRFL